jgi:hypothetical protein
MFAQFAAAEAGKTAQQSYYAHAREECNKYDLTTISLFLNWPIIMIRPSGLLLVVPHIYAVALRDSWGLG